MIARQPGPSLCLTGRGPRCRCAIPLDLHGSRSLATIDFEACPPFVPQLTASSTACWRLTVAGARRRPIQAKAPQEIIDDLLCGWACHLSFPIRRSAKP
jgi:hypothetical protein